MKPAAALVVTLLLAGPAAAQTVAAPTDAQPKAESDTKRALTFLAGAGAGFGLHEAGHVLTSALFGAEPHVRSVEPRPVPFFAIVHNPVSRRQEYVISSSGFWVQHATSEWILSARPAIAHERAPFLKGMLAFNLGASTVYGIAAFARSGPPERDTRGIAVSLGRGGVPEPAVGMLVLAPAVLDGYRYLRPEATWAKWTSRAIKIAGVALIAAAR
jgi:hypothetical protein